MQLANPVYVMGDVHGQLRPLVHILEHAGLLDRNHKWSGRQAILWFMGDLVDRGPDSIPVLDLVIRMQAEAAAAGGQVGCLLGNHELLFLAAYQFGRRSTGLSSNFITKWRQNGGNKADLAKLTKQHLTWLAQLPAMALVDSSLLIHADATFYTRYGHTVGEVNEAIGNILKRSNALAWEELIEEFAMRGVFNHQYAGEEFIDRFLAIFGGTQIVHGHTPIHVMTGSAPKKITAPLFYANNRCINVDGGLSLGGPGFIYQLAASASTQSILPTEANEKAQ
ncbi:MAG: metallophosphoesterase [Ktedonobacteraceae bacterium]